MKHRVRLGALLLAACLAVIPTGCDSSTPSDSEVSSEPSAVTDPAADPLALYREAMAAWDAASPQCSVTELTLTAPIASNSIRQQSRMRLLTDGQQFRLELTSIAQERETLLTFYYANGWLYLDDGQVPVKMRLNIAEALEMAGRFGYIPFPSLEAEQLTEVEGSAAELTAQFPAELLRETAARLFMTEADTSDLALSDVLLSVQLSEKGTLASREVTATISLPSGEQSEWKLSFRETVENISTPTFTLPEGADGFVEYDPNAGV